MRSLLLEVTCIGALLSLPRVLSQFADHAYGMGQVEDDQAFCQARKVYGELPGDSPTPVVSDDGGFISSKMANDGLNISYQIAHRIVLTPLRFVTLVVAAQIECDNLEMGGQRNHLVAPGIPEVGKAMNHDDQWPRANTGVVDIYSVIVRIPMCHVLFNIVGDDGRYSVLHLLFLSRLWIPD